MGGGDQHQNEPVKILTSPVDHCESDNEEDCQVGSNKITQMRHEYNKLLHKLFKTGQFFKT